MQSYKYKNKILHTFLIPAPIVQVLDLKEEGVIWNEFKYLLGKIDPEWIEVNNQPSVNVSVSDKGVAINLVDFNSVIDSAGIAQEQLMNLTREK